MLYAPIFRSLALCLTLSACQNSPPPKVERVAKVEVIEPRLEYDQTQFKLVAVPSVEDIFSLSDEHKNTFLTYYHSPDKASVKGHKRLYHFLEDKLVNFDYLGKTYTASQSVQNAAGNCLTLAIYTTALADLVGLEKGYYKVNSAPIYQRYHNVMTLSSHVQTILYAPEDEVQYLGRPKIIIDYFSQQGNVRGGLVEDDDFIAMFYQNLAGDELVKENYDLAFSLLHKALQIAPYNVNTLNTLAVLFKTVGRADQAEAIYKFTIAHTNGSINIVSNYIVLLEQQSRKQEAELLAEQIEGVDDDNPYRWLDMADSLFSRRKFDLALRFYRRVVEKGPYMHEGHFGLAKTFHQLGKTAHAEWAMKNALTFSYMPGDRDLYQAKLRMLESN